jgi:hypothetical protein
MPTGAQSSIAKRTQSAPRESFWRQRAWLLILVLLLTIFEGAARKWLFPEEPSLRYLAYFAKDIVFCLAAYVGMRKERRFDLSWLILCAILILAPSAISTVASSNVVGMGLSLRAYLIIPVCAFLAAPLVRDFRDVERFAIVVAISSIFIASLGAYQYTLPKSHFLNRYDFVGNEAEATGRLGYVRATGTFSYISGMAIMAGYSAWAGMMLVVPVPGRKRAVQVLGAAALVSGLVCAAAAMSRSGMLFWAITIAGTLMLYLRASTVLISGLVLAMFISTVLETDTVADLDELTQSQTLAKGIIHRTQEENFFVNRVTYVVNNLFYGLVNHPLGEGLGVGQAGGNYAAKGDKSGAGYESEWARIAFEVGPVGLLGVLGIRFTAALLCWRALLQSSNPHRRLVLAAALSFFGVLSLGWMAFNHVGNAAAWSVMALALAATSAPIQVRRSPQRVVRANAAQQQKAK